MTTHAPAQPIERTYGLWTRPRSEGLWGFGWAVTMAAFGAIVIAMVIGLVAGFLVGLIVAAVELVVLAPMAWRVDGRTGYERGILMMQWFRTVLRREHINAGGVFSRRGSCSLPGLMATSQLYKFRDSAGYEFGMVHIPEHNLYTVALRCFPQGARAVDQEMIDSWVGSWGQMLASLGGAADVEAITVVVDTVPETGNRLATEIEAITSPTAPAMAREVMFELADALPHNSVRQEIWCSITFRAMTAERRKDPAEQAVEIAHRLPAIVAALGDAGVGARPMDDQEIIAIVRRAWDPAAEADLEAAHEGDQPHGIEWSEAGPVSYHEHADRLWHDGVNSVSWEMTGAPQGVVRERVLEPLLKPNSDLPRKRVTIVYRPHSADAATKIVDDDHRDSLIANDTARGIGSAQAALRVEATGQAREEQARGHGVTRFGVLITITEPEKAELPRIDALIKALSTQSRLKIRRSYRYQAAAFAASLGMGVLLPEMATIPRTVAE
ncbi:Uncharacterised protein [Nocardia africana]|uniref:Type IV secretory pathway, VirB4 components n=1 Tax=Nocardia africana TaxID=134964 RepID=A0A379X5W3_9NOCA|nr:SCO6880 family protein [Nocardia africana]SUH71891.1 Uncharacterised protein [Nocardia africana]